MWRVASRSFLAQGATDILKPLGLGEGAKFPLSPKSERAYTRISHEFDVLFQALQAEADVAHSDPSVRPSLPALHTPIMSQHLDFKCSHMSIKAQGDLHQTSCVDPLKGLQGWLVHS